MALNMSGEYVLPLPRKDVWKALNDPDMLKRSIPGCESLEKLSDTEFAAVARLEVGPVKARFKGRVKLEDLMPPESSPISIRRTATRSSAKARVALRVLPRAMRL